MKKIHNLSKYEQYRIWLFEIMNHLNSVNKLTTKKLYLKTGKSIKQCKRYIQQYKNKIFSIEHLNKNKTSWKIKDKKISKSIVNKYMEINNEITNFREDSYFVFTHKDFYNSYIKKELNVSYSYVNKLLNKNYLITKNTKSKTIRFLKKQLKQKNDLKTDNKTKSLIEKFKCKYLDLIEHNNSKIIPYVKYNYDFGQIVEIDACVHNWLNKDKFFIYHAIDAGTKKLLAISIDKEETNVGYVKLLKNLFKNYGLPKKIKTDKRLTFWSKDSKTNMTYCLNQLGIEVESKSEPTFKPNVERSFLNAQNFYPIFFFNNNIKTKDDLENNLEILVKAYNKKFNKTAKGKISMFDKISDQKINEAFYIKKDCNVHKGIYIVFENKNLCLFNSQNQRIIMKSKIELRKDMLTEELFTYHQNKKYIFKEINDNQIDLYIDEIYNNEFALIEKEKRKMISTNKRVIANINKKENYLKNLESKLLEKEKYLNNLLQK